MTPGELETRCIAVYLTRQDTITLTLPRGFRPPGWPVGELLSINAAGERNYAFDPLKLLNWLRTQWTDTKEKS